MHVGPMHCSVVRLVLCWVPWSIVHAFRCLVGAGRTARAASCLLRKNKFVITVFPVGGVRGSSRFVLLTAHLLRASFKGLSFPRCFSSRGGVEAWKGVRGYCSRFCVLPKGFLMGLPPRPCWSRGVGHRSLPGVPFIRDQQPIPDFTHATALLV